MAAVELASIASTVVSKSSLENFISSSLPRLSSHVHHCRLAALHNVHRTLQCRTEILGITDRTLAVHTHAFRHFRVIDNGTDESVPYGCTRSIASAPEREPLRFHEFVMEALVVMHDR